MGAITGLLGLGGGASGTGYAPPQAAQITPGTNQQQVGQSYADNQAALAGQQNLLNAIQGQNGLGNQSQVYNQLQQVAAGQGPNPATALLNNATGQNVQQQAALMAGQRGSSANAGLLARQAGQLGAATQQGAVGQAAALQAQQSLGALGQAGQLATTQAGQQIAAQGANTQAQQAEQANLLNSLAQQNQANVSSQNSVNAANAGLASTQMQGQKGLIGGVLGGVGSALGLAEGGSVPRRMAVGGVTAPPITAGFTAGFSPTPGTDPFQSGLTSLGAGIGRLFSSPAPAPAPATPAPLASGNSMEAAMYGAPGTTDADQQAAMYAGPGDQMAEGGDVAEKQAEALQPVTGVPTEARALVPGPRSAVGKILKGIFESPSAAPEASAGDETPVDSKGKLLKALGGGTDVGSKLKQGGHVPGKPKVGGATNSYANDTVDAKLSPGEIVLPRTVTQSSDPVNASAKFVAALMAKRGKK